MATLDEYQKLCNEVMENPDNAPAVMAKMLDCIKEEITTIETQSSLISQHESKISELRDTNHKLFLRSTSQPIVKEEEVTPEQELDDWLSKEYKIEVNNNE